MIDSIKVVAMWNLSPFGGSKVDKINIQMV